MATENPPRRLPSAWEFNKEIILGEAGSLVGAAAAAFAVAHLTRNPALISASLIPGTLLGGTMLWLATRIAHHQDRRTWSMGALVRDISYFTPVAATLGLTVYSPTIYLVSHLLLVRGARVAVSVVAGQVVAFSLFLSLMNAYREILIRAGGRHL